MFGDAEIIDTIGGEVAFIAAGLGLAHEYKAMAVTSAIAKYLGHKVLLIQTII